MHLQAWKLTHITGCAKVRSGGYAAEFVEDNRGGSTVGLIDVILIAFQ